MLDKSTLKYIQDNKENKDFNRMVHDLLKHYDKLARKAKEAKNGILMEAIKNGYEPNFPNQLRGEWDETKTKYKNA